MNIQQKTLLRIRLGGRKSKTFFLLLLVLAMVHTISNYWMVSYRLAKQGLLSLISGTHKSELDKLSQLKQHAVAMFAKGSRSLFYTQFWFTGVSIKS